MKNKLTDLNDHLFAQLERLSDESITGEALTQEIVRSRAVATVAKEIIENGRLVLSAQKAYSDGQIGTVRPEMLAIEQKPNGK